MDVTVHTCLSRIDPISDDWYQREAAPQPRRRGHQAALSDRAVRTRAVRAAWQHDRREHAFLRFVAAHGRSYVPLPPRASQGADGVPVPLLRRCRRDRRRTFAHAAGLG
jgi:hypothetical protein